MRHYVKIAVNVKRLALSICRFRICYRMLLMNLKNGG